MIQSRNVYKGESGEASIGIDQAIALGAQPNRRRTAKPAGCKLVEERFVQVQIVPASRSLV